MRITRRNFDAMLEQAIDELPKKFARWLDEVPIIVEDEPPDDLLDELGIDADGDLLGSYHGVAITRRSVEDSPHLPDQIFLFRRPLMAMCDTSEQLAKEIRKTLLHELGHYAGFDEGELEDMGYA